MKNNNIPFTLIMMILSSTTSFAEGGNGAGNGGGGHLCFDEATKQNEVSVEAYDLYEARKIYRLKLTEFSPLLTKNEILNIILKKIEKTQYGLADRMRKTLAGMNNQPDFYTDASEMNIPMAKLPYNPPIDKNCKYIPIVNWFDKGQYAKNAPQIVFRDEHYYQNGPVHLNAVHQAAIDIHESAYKVARGLEEKFLTPEYASAIRRFTGQVFSTSEITEVLYPVEEINPPIYFAESTVPEEIEAPIFDRISPKIHVGAKVHKIDMGWAYADQCDFNKTISMSLNFNGFKKDGVLQSRENVTELEKNKIIIQIFLTVLTKDSKYFRINLTDQVNAYELKNYTLDQFDLSAVTNQEFKIVGLSIYIKGYTSSPYRRTTLQSSNQFSLNLCGKKIHSTNNNYSIYRF